MGDLLLDCLAALCGFAEILHAADFTFWTARRTDGAAMQNEPVAEIV